MNALRALAVAFVIAYHYGVPATRSGFIGVDVFFVISGFLIGGQVMRAIGAGEFRLAAFFASRIRRIVPALAVLCAVLLAVGAVFELPDEFVTLARAAAATMAFFANYFYSAQVGYFAQAADNQVLLHAWSLAVEAQFYLVLPFLLIALRKNSMPATLLVLVALAAASLAFALDAGATSPRMVFFSLPSRAWEFLAGCIVATLPAVKMSARLARALNVACWIALAVCCAALPAFGTWPAKRAVIPVVLTAAIIYLGGTASAGTVARLPLVQHLGRISYSLYLWHWPVLVAWRLVSFQHAPGITTGLLLVATTWGLSWLSWRYVEQPARASAVLRLPRIAMGATAAMTLAFAGVGAAAVGSGGFPARLPDYLQGAAAAAPPQDSLDDCAVQLRSPVGDRYVACPIGNASAPPTFIVWGDSHALHYWRALQRADAEGLRGILFYGPTCEPGVPASRNPRDDESCDAQNLEVWSLLARTPTIRTVLLSIRVTGADRLVRERDTAARLLARGYRVVWVGPTPEFDVPVAPYWAGLERAAGDLLPDLDIERHRVVNGSSYAQRLEQWRAAANTLGASDRLALVDPSRFFCDARACSLVANGVGLFRDRDHLTDVGADRVAPALLESIRRAAR